ncbi:MAG: hypothetical protein AB7H92_19370 [Microbacteriaceae bacterium]
MTNPGGALVVTVLAHAGGAIDTWGFAYAGGVIGAVVTSLWLVRHDVVHTRDTDPGPRRRLSRSWVLVGLVCGVSLGLGVGRALDHVLTDESEVNGAPSSTAWPFLAATDFGSHPRSCSVTGDEARDQQHGGDDQEPLETCGDDAGASDQ